MLRLKLTLLVREPEGVTGADLEGGFLPYIFGNGHPKADDIRDFCCRLLLRNFVAQQKSAAATTPNAAATKRATNTSVTQTMTL